MQKVVIVTTGNEVLNGDVLDTNTNWLCQRITRMGGFVESAALIRDDVEAIAREIRLAIERGADLVITVGGLGPTADDMTLQAVANATGHALAVQPEALEQITRKYADLARAGAVQDAAITPAREKMAILPEGASPLANPVGAAPGVLLPLVNSMMVSLPGVPAELRAIFSGPLQPALLALFGVAVFVEKTAIVASGDESVLATILHEVSQRHPDVYVKSHAQRFGPDVSFRVTVSRAGASLAQVTQELDSALESLQAALRARGIAIVSVEETPDSAERTAP